MKKRNKSRLARADVNTIRNMQRDIDYMKQFLVNVPIMFMGKTPAILISCSSEVEMLCDKCWEECLKVAEKIGVKKQGEF